MKPKRILFINDYACSPEAVKETQDGLMPRNHLWGITELIEDSNKIEFCNPNEYYIFKTSWGRLKKINYAVSCIFIFFRFIKSDVVYSALPGYELLFLFAKRLKLKNYKIITVVHHPSSKIRMKKMFSKLIFISRHTYNKYSQQSNCLYQFWGPDLNFYKATGVKDKTIDFIAAGKTLRDYITFRKALHGLDSQFVIIGEKDNKRNEVSYPELLDLYSVSKFIVIPLVRLKNPESKIIGLTSVIDALGMGIPLIISDNSNIGIDIEKMGLGFTYRSEDALDMRDKLKRCLNMSDSEYSAICDNCRKFAYQNNFEKFSKSICELIKDDGNTK